MSRLRELMAELCPDGVEYQPIKDCVESVEKIQWKLTDETYRYIDLSSVDRDDHMIGETIEISGDNAPSRAQQIVKAGDILFGTTRPMLKRYCQIPLEYDSQICSTGFCVLRADNARVLNRWLYHMISTTVFFDYVDRTQHGSSYPAISDKEVKAYEIPVPPLPIQNEIVKLLDNFTELTAELTAELLLRKKQYNFYRDSLLNFARVDDTIVQTERKTELGIGKVVSFLLLSELAEIGTGGSNTNEGLSEGTYPFFVRSQEVRWKNTYEYDETAIITSGDGVGVGKIFHYIEGKYALHQRAYRIHVFDERLLPKFLFYYMKASFYRYITQNAVQSSVTSIRRPMLDKYPIPIPPLEVQQKIVSILDHFDTLCNDLTQGLPAEIAARRKQYEYYRDKLLTFPRKAV